jgi:signal transduction histidine kinase
MRDSSAIADAAEAASAASRAAASDRVRALEALAGMIAHEIRSSVLAMTSAAQILRYSLPQDPVAERSLGRILQESERLSALHDALSEYATEVPPRRESLNPDAVWNKALGNSRALFEARGLRAKHVVSSSVQVAGDPDQLCRAFERLLRHAVARAQGAGEIVVESTAGQTWNSILRLTPGQGEARTSAPDPERRSLELTLADRTLTAHGGELIVSGANQSSIVEARLPISGSR